MPNNDKTYHTDIGTCCNAEIHKLIKLHICNECPYLTSTSVCLLHLLPEPHYFKHSVFSVSSALHSHMISVTNLSCCVFQITGPASSLEPLVSSLKYCCIIMGTYVGNVYSYLQVNMGVFVLCYDIFAILQHIHNRLCVY